VKKFSFGSIKIKEEIGKGAFGRVFKSEWNDKTVALKSIDIKITAKNFNLEEKYIKEAIQWEIS